MSRLASLCCVLVCCLGVHAGDANKEAELKWAKGVVSDFLQSAKQQDYDQAEILVTKELKDVMQKVIRNFYTGVRGWISEHRLEEASWSFGGEEISPDRDEAVIKGTFKRDKEDADFTFRLVKEKDNGKWRINYLSCGKWSKAQVKPKN